MVYGPTCIGSLQGSLGETRKNPSRYHLLKRLLTTSSTARSAICCESSVIFVIHHTSTKPPAIRSERRQAGLAFQVTGVFFQT